MRNLRNSDLLKMVEIMTSAEGVVKELGDLLYETKEDKSDKTKKEKVLDGIEIARVVIYSCIRNTGTDILKFLADIAEMEYEEFDVAGPRKLTETIEHLGEQDDIAFFFRKAYRLFQTKKSIKKDTTKT